MSLHVSAIMYITWRSVRVCVLNTHPQAGSALLFLMMMITAEDGVGGGVGVVGDGCGGPAQ